MSYLSSFIKGLAAIIILLFTSGFLNPDDAALIDMVQKRPMPIEEKELIRRLNPPKNVRSVYLTTSSFASERGDEMIRQLIESGGNAIVVDVEHGGGRLAFEPKNEWLRQLNPGSTLLNDFSARIQKLHEQGIYVIARLVVFNDPFMAARKPEWRIANKWGGLFDANWLDPSKQEVQSYNLYVMQELAEMGFDEIQLDYIRFPAANHSQLDYHYDESRFTRVEVINDFLSKARRVADYYDVRLSADVFGVIVWGDVDWRGIGQDPKTIPDYLDFIYPMTYPSHYSPGFYQHSNPWGAPYDIIYHSIDRFVKAADGRAQIRIWVQGFPLKIPQFGTWFIEEQIRAAFDAGATGFAIWSPGNYYTLSWPAISVEAPVKACVMDDNWNCITYDLQAYKGR